MHANGSHAAASPPPAVSAGTSSGEDDMGFGGCEGVADTQELYGGDCRGETEAELRRTMERMDGYRIPREGEAISYYLPAATFPFPFPNDTALVPCGHRRSESRPPWCRVFTDCGFGGPCWGVISVFLGGRSLGRLPSSFWSRGYPRRREKHADIAAIGGIFCLEKKANWSAGREASCRTAVEANGQVPVWWCGGLFKSCQVFRYQIAGREFKEA